MKLTELITNLESCLFGNLNYGIMSLLRDEKEVSELIDMLRELLERRKADGSEDGDDALQEHNIGKATLQEKFFEKECSTYGSAILNIKRMIDKYNKIAIENKDKGFPIISFEWDFDDKNRGEAIIKHKLEVRMPVTGM